MAEREGLLGLTASPLRGRRHCAPTFFRTCGAQVEPAGPHQGLPTLINKKAPGGALLFIGGERGIRTLDTLPYTHFPGVLLQPLGHLSSFLLQLLYILLCYFTHGARGRARYSTASQSHPFGAAVATLRRSFGCASSQPLGHLSGFLAATVLYTSVFLHARSMRACSLFGCASSQPLGHLSG